MDRIQQVTILIVDDVRANSIALQSLLEKEGRTFLSAQSGNEALKIVRQTSVDLIILDVQMADMDGFEVAQLLKSNQKTKEIPIIFASAERKEHVSVLKGFEEGGVDYLSKPLDPDITRAKVSIFLQIQIQKKELQEKNVSLERSGVLINNSADIIGIMNVDTLMFQQINKAVTTTLGYTQDEMTTMHFTSFLDYDNKAILENFQKESQAVFSFEIMIAARSGEIKWLQWNVIAQESNWFINARDVTNQKSMDDKIKQLNANLVENLKQLEMANKELESFSYSISHDLRSPLRSINAYSQILEKEYGHELTEDAKKILHVVQRNADKMDHLIDDLLEFSKMSRKEIRKLEINMEHLVQGVIEDINTSAGHKSQISIHNLFPIYADRSLLVQVWVNLISNAIKYSGKKEHSTIEIGSTIQDQEIVYYVKDNGAGFNMDYADKLFCVFQRLHSNKEFEGTGIGLAIVQRIINRHGGKIWAEGKVNEGATFYFSLPKIKQLSVMA